MNVRTVVPLVIALAVAGITFALALTDAFRLHALHRFLHQRGEDHEDDSAVISRRRSRRPSRASRRSL